MLIRMNNTLELTSSNQLQIQETDQMGNLQSKQQELRIWGKGYRKQTLKIEILKRRTKISTNPDEIESIEQKSKKGSEIGRIEGVKRGT